MDRLTVVVEKIAGGGVRLTGNLLVALAGTCLANFFVDRQLQDLWFWVTDLQLLSWSSMIGILLLCLSLLVSHMIHQTRLRWLSWSVFSIGLISLVLITAAFKPTCGAFRKLEVRSIAPALSGACVSAYATNGKFRYRFETEDGQRYLHVALQTFGESDEGQNSDSVVDLDYNSGVVISLPNREWRSVEGYSTLSLEIRGTVGPGGLWLGAKDAATGQLISGTEIKRRILRGERWVIADDFIHIDDWTELRFSLSEFREGNYRVDLSRLKNLSFSTTNQLSDVKAIAFDLRNIRFSDPFEGEL